MKLLSLKSLSFYGGAIVSVVILFSITTTYGEMYLKAATGIAGRYPLSTDNCLDHSLLRLDQSGRYLTAAIVLPTMPNLAAIPPTFSGTWSGQPTKQGITVLSLTGQLPKIPNCYPTQHAWIQGTLEKQAFSGDLILADGTRLPFRSQLEPEPAETTLNRSH